MEILYKVTKGRQKHFQMVDSASLGGWIGSEIGKTMERYDPEENKWEVIGSMAVPRYYFGCCELQGVFLKTNTQTKKYHPEQLAMPFYPPSCVSTTVYFLTPTLGHSVKQLITKC